MNNDVTDVDDKIMSDTSDQISTSPILDGMTTGENPQGGDTE